MHIGNPAGVATLLTEGLREREWDAQAYVTGKVNSYSYDVRKTNRLSLLIKAIRSDNVHFHGRSRELPMFVDSNKVVWHYHGDELRAARNGKPHRSGILWLVSTRDLLVDPKLEWLPNPIDMKNWPLMPATSNNIPVIIHHTNKFRVTSKGTDQIKQEIERLRKKGLKFEYREVAGYSHDDMKRVIAEADIVIDVLSVGWYGMLALEALCTGRPVVNRIEPTYWIDNSQVFFDLKDLEALVQDDNLRKSRIAAGLSYVKKYHDLPKVTDLLIEKYEGVGIKRKS